MGMAKQQQIMCDERKYGNDDSRVCKYCIGNKHLSQFVYENGDKMKCSFCGKNANCITIEDLSGEIMDAIALEYVDANECMGWEGGEYIGANTWDTYDLLNDLNDDMQLADNVLESICNNIYDITWCETDPYSLRSHKEHHYMWQSFCEMVKHRTRYVFFRMPKKHNYYDEKSPFLILDHIAEAADKLGLFEKVKKGTHFYRGRTHEEPNFFSKPSCLSSPPNNRAKANRMSAEGISVFYGADSEKTALSEISTDTLCFATVARFRSLRDLIVLDLTKIHKFSNPSLFDNELGKYREQIAFIRSLEKDLTKPIKGELGIDAIQYVPAQVVAEYFRYLHKVQGKSIDGIAYRSAEYNDGTCYALFFNQKQCLFDPQCAKIQQLEIVKRSYRKYKMTGSWEDYK